MVDALGVVVELNGALALLAEAVAQHRALFLIRTKLDQPTRLGVDAAPYAAVHVAHEAARATPPDAVLINRVVENTLHGNFAHDRLLSLSPQNFGNVAP